MARAKKKTATKPERVGVKRHGKINQGENKQLDVKSSEAQREGVKVAPKSAKVGAAAVRQCAVTRERKPESQLLRFVLDGQGRITPDIKRRLPGRGVWVTANRSVLADALRRRVLLRGLKAESGLRDHADVETVGGAGSAPGREGASSVGEPADLLVVVEGLLRRSALGALSLANKAGQLTLGFEAVAKALASRGVIGLVHASDCADDGRLKLDRLFGRTTGRENAGKNETGSRIVTGRTDEGDGVLNDPSDVDPEESVWPIVGIFSCEELSSTLGRTNVMHAALKEGGASASFLKEAQRLSSYLGPAPARPSRRRLKQDKV